MRTTRCDRSRSTTGRCPSRAGPRPSSTPGTGSRRSGGGGGTPAEWRGRKIEADGRVAGILRDYDVQVKKLRDSKIGETAVELKKGGKDDLLANLAADAMRSGAGGGLKANFAFQNSGGLRISEIPAGPITFGQIFD